MKEDYLFSTFIFSEELSNRHVKIRDEIYNIPEEEFLQRDQEELREFYDNKFKVRIPCFPEPIEKEISVRKEDVDVDVSQDFDRAIFDRSRPYYIKRPRLLFFIPFFGDYNLFYFRPSTYTLNPPRAGIKNKELVISIYINDTDQNHTKEKMNKELSEIMTNLNRLRQDCQEFNGNLPGYISSIIKQRREEILKKKNFVSSLGYRLKVDEDIVQTLTLPKNKRAAEPSKTVRKEVVEPIPRDGDYDHILDIIKNMSHVFERSPEAFRDINEEHIREHFLVQLNGFFRGQATGETFNFEGKTDILIRREGKNAFIAECKFWNGPGSLLKAVDQLLGYASWRDTKMALLVFNRNKDLSSVLKKIPETIKGHPSFKREIKTNGETDFRYILHHKDDKERDIVLAILVFEVPK